MNKSSISNRKYLKIIPKTHEGHLKDTSLETSDIV